jgi:hypothetical protein
MIGTGAGSKRALRAGRAGRALGSWPVLVTAALLVAAGGCGGAAPSPAAGGSRPAPSAAGGTVALSGSPAAGGGTLSVLSVSFVSASAGWLLATPCANQVQTCRTVLMRRTVDGGRDWSGVAAPDAPPADIYQGSPPPNAVGSILFAGGGAGWAFGPALWQTRDDGASWRKVSVPGGAVQDLGVAGGRVLAATGRCGNGGGTCSFRVYAGAFPGAAGADGADSWQALPGAAGSGVGPVRLVVSGGVGYVFAISANQGRPLLLLAGPVNGSARWRPVPDPCRGAFTGGLAAAPGGWLFLGCGSEPGVGNQIKTAYLSDDGGRSWQQVASPPFAGYLGGASMSPGGTIFLSGNRMGIYVSWDRGRSWHQSPSLASAAGLAGAGLPLTGSTVTDTFGFAFQEGVGQRQVWLTSDGGRRWAPVTVR